MQMNYLHPLRTGVVKRISKFSSEYPSIRENPLILEAVHDSGTFL